MIQFELLSFSLILLVIIFVMIFEIYISFKCWDIFTVKPSLATCELFLQFPFAQSADCII